MVFSKYLTSSACIWKHAAALPFSTLNSRKVVWYGPVSYKYSKQTHLFNDKWPAFLIDLRKQLYNDTGLDFNSVLVNYYADGNSSVGWHADNESIFKDKYPIASLSIGCTREFQVKSISSNEIRSYFLKDCMLIVMQGDFQHEFVHRVPSNPLINKPRINITFRRTG